jgi:FtsP/CotA-like multicopper oxidase with cupredoxin domain
MKNGYFVPWRLAILLSIAVLAIGFALAQSQLGVQSPGDTPKSVAQTPVDTPIVAALISAVESKEEPATEMPAAASDAGAEAGAATAEAEAAAAAQDAVAGRTVSRMRSTTQAQREAAVRNAARRRAALGQSAVQPQAGTVGCSAAFGTPCVQVNYFTSTPNYALSKFTDHVTSAANVSPKVYAVDTGIHKFQDGLAGLGPANHNNLNNYIPVATPMTNPWGNGGDYYEIALKDYTQQFNTDLPATTQLRGYVDLNPTPLAALRNAADTTPRYLGPVILAVKGRPVRAKFRNMLTGFLNQAGAPIFFIPADQSYMGMSHTDLSNNTTWFSINRATVHLHGGATPWISDGTPHQWTVPEGEYATATYKRGASVQFVPDMYFNPTTHLAEARASTSTNDPGPGALSFFWTNDQSSRFMFYHDHSYGTTRLNVYAGEAGGYLLHDPAGLDTLIDTAIPNNAMVDLTSNTLLAQIPTAFAGVTLTQQNGGLYRFGIPLVIQDKTFVPPQAQLTAQDPSWNWGNEGNLWFPHVYMPNQNPNDDSGASIAGRWDYGPWFWPPMTSADLAHGAITCLGTGDTTAAGGYGTSATCPGTLNPSGVPESFLDTPVVNGVAYPKVTLPQGAYRFQVLNAANDRMFNLSLFYAADAAGNVCTTSTAYAGHNYAFGTNVQPATTACTEVKMVPAAPHPLIQSTTPAPLPAPGADADADDPIPACAATPSQPDVIRGSGFLVVANAPGTGNPDLPGHNIGGVDAANPGAISYNPNTGLPGTAAASCWPSSWPTDGRDGGVPDPATAGPPWVQIGTEGGILPAPVVIPATPVGYNYNRRDIVVTNVQEHALFLGPAERADVIADFTNVPVGSTLILYNDSPAPVPGFDTRLDYYTGAPDLSSTGGSPTPQPGYGPNIRTIMQITIGAPASTQSTFNLATLKAVLPAKFAATQPAIIVPETTYSAAAIGTLPTKDSYARIQNMSLSYTPTGGTLINPPLLPKAIHELFENDYGKMNSILAEEIPLTNYNNQTTIPLAYVDPPTDIVGDGETQLWKVTHNGVDSHAIHFHLFNVQLINRVGWDGAIRPPDPNELGWKETVRMNPLEDAFVALKPVKMALPATADFAIPQSSRLFDVTRDPGATNATGLPGFTNVDPNGNGVTIVNALNNFSWEYVWHCHLLGHEESDMMRPLVFTVLAPNPPTNLTDVVGGTQAAPTVRLNWQYAQGTPAGTSFLIRKTVGSGATTLLVSGIAITGSGGYTYTDTSAAPGATTTYAVYAVAGSSLSTPATLAVTLAAAPPLLATPGTISTTLLSATRVFLQWVAPSPITGVTGYIIQRAPNTNTNAAPVQGAFVNVGTSTNTTFQNVGLTTNTIYWYRVQATGAGGATSAYSPVLQIHTP